MDTEITRRVVNEFFSAFNTGNADAIAKLFSDDVRIWVAGDTYFSGDYDIERFFELAGTMFNLFDSNGFKFVPQGMVVEGGRAAVEAVSDATHRDGTAYCQRYHLLFAVNEHEKIYQYKEYMDTRHAADVLGSTSPRLA